MEGSESAVPIDKKDMDALERIARNAGTTPDRLARLVLRKTLDALEEACRSHDPLNQDAPAANIRPGLALVSDTKKYRDTI